MKLLGVEQKTQPSRHRVTDEGIDAFRQRAVQPGNYKHVGTKTLQEGGMLHNCMDTQYTPAADRLQRRLASVGGYERKKIKQPARFYFCRRSPFSNKEA